MRTRFVEIKAWSYDYGTGQITTRPMYVDRFKVKTISEDVVNDTTDENEMISHTVVNLNLGGEDMILIGQPIETVVKMFDEELESITHTEATPAAVTSRINVKVATANFDITARVLAELDAVVIISMSNLWVTLATTAAQRLALAKNNISWMKDV